MYKNQLIILEGPEDPEDPNNGFEIIETYNSLFPALNNSDSKQEPDHSVLDTIICLTPNNNLTPITSLNPDNNLTPSTCLTTSTNLKLKYSTLESKLSTLDSKLSTLDSILSMMNKHQITYDENKQDLYDDNWPGEINVPCGMKHLKYKSVSFPAKNSSNKLERLKCAYNSFPDNSVITELQKDTKFYNKYLQSKKHLKKQESEYNKKLISRERKRVNFNDALF